MNIPANLILLWAGTHAGIPTKWVRETTLDGKYPKAWGDAVTPNTTGGASTHTHTSPAHSHTMNNHTHDYYLNIADSVPPDNGSVGGLRVNDHRHKGTSGAVSGGSTSSVAVTYGAVSNDPLHHELIFIKAEAGAIIENDIIALWNGWDAELTTPDNWQYCNGSNGSPDLRNKYVKGAGTGADAGTTGGSTTNTHSITHTHTATAHSHVAADSGVAIRRDSDSLAGDMNDGSPAGYMLKSHVHSVALDSQTPSISNSATSLVTTETVEPAYTKLGAIQKKANGIKVRGIIGMWLGDIADIPAGWVVCDGTNDTPDLRDKFIKIATDSTEFGDMGGSNTHTHGAQAHNGLTGASHSHGAGSISAHVNATGYGGGGSSTPNTSVQHVGLQSCTSAVTSYVDANTTADSSDNQPEYRTVAYVQFQVPTDGGAFLENFM